MIQENHVTQRYRGPIQPQTANIIQDKPDAETDKVVDVIIDALGSSTSMTMEGPPIYLGQDHPELPAVCRWDSLSFSRGWALANAITSGVLSRSPHTQVHHPLFIDDLNYAPPDGFRFSHLRQLRSQQIFRGPLAHRSVTRMETDFRVSPTDTCALMDARFQFAEKIARLPGDALHVVVHPNGFRRQQSAMLEGTLGFMKSGTIFSGYSKKQRREILGHYRHVWVNDMGKVEQITQPKFDGDRFQHELIQ